MQLPHLLCVGCCKQESSRY